MLFLSLVLQCRMGQRRFSLPKRRASRSFYYYRVLESKPSLEVVIVVYSTLIPARGRVLLYTTEVTFALYFVWHYGDGMRRALGLARNAVLLPLHMFSIKELLQTLFSPWKQITSQHPRELLSAESLEAYWNNLISRVIGAIMRLILIALGLVFVAVAAVCAVALVVGWVTAPMLPVAFFFIGVALL